jgi:hypothetical protein
VTHPDDDAYEAFLNELARLERESRLAEEMLAEAEETYAPASVPVPLPPTTLEPATRPPPKWIAVLTDQPDRVVTYPVWAVFVTAAYLGLAGIFLGALVFATALVFLLARLLDAPVGIPALRFAAVCAGLLAGLGTFVNLWQSYRRALARCPR